MPEISLIIPVYNCQKTLVETLASVKGQCFDDFEVILVDDGSTDGSSAICDEFASQDFRVRVIHQKNGGASKARNTGIDNADGKWIVFLDSDDIIGPDYLSELYKNKVPKGLCIAGFYEVNDGKTSVSVDFGFFVYDKLDGSMNNIYDNDLLLRHPSPVARIFDKYLIDAHGIRFDDRVSLCEDLLFWQDYILHCCRVVLIPPVEYYYLKDNSTLTKRKIAADMAYILSQSYLSKVNMFAKENSLERIDNALEWGAILVMGAIAAIYNGDLSKKSGKAFLRKVLKDNSRVIACYYKPTPRFLRFKKWLLLTSPTLFHYLGESCKFLGK